MSETSSGGRNRQAMMGNEACARGAYEAGVCLATGYPGTPATPAVEYLLEKFADRLRVEWAVNEKVALEMAAAVSWAGKRGFVALKMSGLNVASDSLLSVAASGAVGGLVILVGDDPGAHYGMVEQDSRLFARLAVLPMVEPATPDEAKELTVEAFEVSEAHNVPVMVRLTTTTANNFGPVFCGERVGEDRRASLPDDLDRFTKASAAACRGQHARAIERLAGAGKALDRWNVYAEGKRPLGIVAVGSAWPYVQESLAARAPGSFHTLRLTTVHPLPEEKLRHMLDRCERVLVVEELETLVEDALRALASDGPSAAVLGKREGVLSPVGNFDPDLVEDAVRWLEGAAPTEIPPAPDLTRYAPRTLTFCPGCPHRSTYAALDRAIRSLGHDPKDVMVTGDIGCTILGMNPPYSLCRTEVSMGASIAMAQGFAYAGVKTPVVAAVGDSTFLHAGLPALVNAAGRGVSITVLVMDNRCAAMTGFQPTAAAPGKDDHIAQTVDLAGLARAAGVRRIRAGFPYFHRRLTRVLMSSMTSPGVSVVVAEAPCVAAERPPLTLGAYRVSRERCIGLDRCDPSCVSATACPAIERDEDGKAWIDEVRCLGCGLCAEACPEHAVVRGLPGLWKRRR